MGVASLIYDYVGKSHWFPCSCVGTHTKLRLMASVCIPSGGGGNEINSNFPVLFVVRPKPNYFDDVFIVINLIHEPMLNINSS